ncbi:PREDICTED: uncharacterized protein LOC109221465 [Nicotiana attenuata]|uniref:uncharacterized protein LOC109221465 n=1 Tax=Nicotiana attenuata TaxID=49451 RepID=UPI000904F562|nr:PREDICTED: uncharacterized protein LOC109221465 [Nicotiana attenuata]
MRGIPLEIASHRLSVNPKFRPVKQKRRPQSEVKHAFVKEELAKLLKIGSIRECHRICALTTYPLWSILHKPELSGRLAKWAIELGGYDIEYQPRTAIKSQILADFVADFSSAVVPEVEKEFLSKSGTSSGVWTLFTDGAANVRGSGLSIVLRPPVGGIIRQSIKTTKLTNNEAEYEAMIAGLDLAKGLGAEIVEAKRDLLLVDAKVFGQNPNRVTSLQRMDFSTHTRDQNCEADAHANLGSSAEEEDLLPGTVVQLFESAVEDGHAEINSTSLTWVWRNRYIAYLKDEKVPTDPKESRALRTKAARFPLDKNGALYRRTFDGPLAICLGPGDTEYVLREIHEGTCRNHFGADSLVRKVIRAGYYWDSMEKDAKEFVRKCEKCQRFAPMIHRPGEQLHSILSPWPFMKWGMDIVGPLPTAPGKVTQFLEDNGIKRILSTPYHPCANGQAESTIKTIIQNLKRKLESAKGKWRETLPEVLWAYRTTTKLSTDETPFSQVYGAKALIPVEAGEPSARFQHIGEESNNESMATALELLDEKREALLVRMAAQK